MYLCILRGGRFIDCASARRLYYALQLLHIINAFGFACMRVRFCGSYGYKSEFIMALKIAAGCTCSDDDE